MSVLKTSSAPSAGAQSSRLIHGARASINFRPSFFLRATPCNPRRPPLRAASSMLLVLKLFFLGVRQISKPIANRAKDAAHSSGFMKAVAVGLGRGMNRLQTQVTRLSEGKTPLLKVTPLEEEEALVRTVRSRHPSGDPHQPHSRVSLRPKEPRRCLR